MKMFKAVEDRIEEYRYKKGITRVDTKNAFYKVSKILYIISFAWMMAFLLLYILGVTLQLATGYDVRASLLVSSLLIALAAIAGLVLMCMKKHLASLIANLFSAVYCFAFFMQDESVQLGLLDDGFSSKFIWRHFAPAVLIIIFSLIVCLIGIKVWFNYRADYKKVLDSMYIRYKEENPTASDAEWQAFLEESSNVNT